MTTRTYTHWVEPMAVRDHEGRAELIEFARSVPEDVWRRPSPLEGWTCKDVLAHLAGDTGKWFAHILQSVIRGEGFDLERAGPRADVDAINARDIRERDDRSAAELIAEITADGEEHEELLSRLTQDHKDKRLTGYEIGLAEFLASNAAGSRGGHDREHLAQLRTALDIA